MELSEYQRMVLAVFAGACLFSHAATVAAQTTGSPAIEQEETVVWAERPALAIGAAGATATAGDADTALAKDIGELLQSTVPGITGQRLGGAQVDPVLRGTRAERVPVTIDGAQVHGACPSRMDPETSLVDVTALDEATVVKGPYSVTRGPVGVGGTITIRTQDPQLSPSLAVHGSALVGYTSNYEGWTTRGSASVGGPRAAARLSGGWRHFNDYSSGHGERIPSSFRNRNLGGVLLWQPTPEDGLRLSGNIEAARDMEFASSRMDTAKEDVYLGTVRYTRRRPLPAVEEVSATAYYNYVDHLMNNAHKPDASMIKMSAPLTAKTAGGRVQGNLSPFWRTRVTLGGDVYRVAHDGTRQMTRLASGMPGITGSMGSMPEMVMTSMVWPDAHLLDGGLFAEASYSIAPQWLAVVGTRLDLIDAHAHPDQAARDAFVHYYGAGAADPDAGEANVSANGRLIYSPIDTVDLFLGIGRGVRTASATERFYVFGPGLGGFLVGNPTLDPEESFATDLGVDAQWHGLSLNGSFFYTRVHKYIAPVLLAEADLNMDGQVDLVRGFRNIDVATLLGVDGGVAYVVSDWLRVFGSLAYVYGENETLHQPLAEIPPLEGTVGVHAQRTWKGGWFGWIMPRLRLVAGQDRIDPDFGQDASPPFATVDVLSGLRLHDRYELTLNVSNLFDTNYYEYLTPENPFTGAEVPEPGRMVSVGLRVTL